MAVETNLKNLNDKVDNGFADLKGTMKDISTQIQLVIPTLVTHAQMTEKITDLEKQLVDVRNDLLKSKGRNTLQTWITSSLSAAFAVLLTILIQSYFRG